MDVYFQLFREVVDGHSAPDAAAEGNEEVDGETEEKGQGKGKDKDKDKGKDAMCGEKKNSQQKAKEVQAMPFSQFSGADVEYVTSIHIITSLPSLPASSMKSLPSAVIASRYFCTLYATLLDPRLYTSSKQAMYLNLLFKSLKSDLVSMVDKLNEVKSLTDESQKYDLCKRDPQYAHASLSPLWELTPLFHYAHPTLSLLAHQLLAHQPLTMSPDLSLHTLTHFLDCFVYKNLKKVKPKGMSTMQPMAAVKGDGMRRMRGQVQEVPVNEEQWWRWNEGSVPTDQVFFLSYFSQKHEKKRAKAMKADKWKNRKEDSDEEQESGMDDEEVEVKKAEGQLDEDSDAKEAEIWK
ncbi:hypothetical protein EW146_g9990, partial [Bondarzewia mesenterica]